MSNFACPHCGQPYPTSGQCYCPGATRARSYGARMMPPPHASAAPQHPMGWQCPRCGRVHAPFISECFACNRQSVSVTADSRTEEDAK